MLAGGCEGQSKEEGTARGAEWATSRLGGMWRVREQKGRQPVRRVPRGRCGWFRRRPGALGAGDRLHVPLQEKGTQTSSTRTM